MQNLDPKLRKGEHKYNHGDWVSYDDRPTMEQQIQLLEDSGKEGEYLKLCPVCGRYMLESDRRKYCSGRCANDSFMARRHEQHQQELMKSCTVCGRHFKAKRKDALYCSTACKQAAYRDRKA